MNAVIRMSGGGSQSDGQFGLVVAAAADSSYAWPAALSLLSACVQCSEPLACLLVGDQLEPSLASAVRATFEHHAIPFIYVDSDLTDLGSLPVGFHFSRATYGRLLVVDAASSLAARTLYLDSDTLVVGDVSPLAYLPLGPGDVVAAVRAPGIPTAASPGGVSDWKERGLDPGAPFFNAGVLLIDNERWRQREISKVVVEDLSASPDAATFADQGTLNAVLSGCWTELTSDWNYQLVRAPALRLGPYAVSYRYRLDLRRARILHYFQSIKPWDRRYPPGALTNLYREAWEELLPLPAPSSQTFRQWLRERH
jgi:lipopolysaccharide biosynthesis glycosyltransferase